MKEHEVKILEVDEKQIINKLEQLNAELLFDGDMHSLYYKQNESVLRLRKKGDKTLLTLKIPEQHNQIKIYHEHEVEIEDFNAIRTILSKMSLDEFAEDKRKRKSYKLINSTIEINQYAHIPTFLEIESESEQELMQTLELLGYTIEQTRAWSGKDVLNYYKQ